jgi:hypothetical protein
VTWRAWRRLLAAGGAIVALGCSDGSSLTGASGDRWGAVGCSQTIDAVEGYELVGGRASWPHGALAGYAGGHLLTWANPQDSRWDVFQAALDANGATVVWLEICIEGRTNPAPSQSDLDAGRAVVTEIRRRAPGTTVVVSAMNEYRGIVCGLSGPAGPAVARAIADSLVRAGVASAGPEVGPLSSGTTESDGCHANDAGKRLQGQQLRDFFG